MRNSKKVYNCTATYFTRSSLVRLVLHKAQMWFELSFRGACIRIYSCGVGATNLFIMLSILYVVWLTVQIARFMGSTWGPPGSCRPPMGPTLAPWTLLSGWMFLERFYSHVECQTWLQLLCWLPWWISVYGQGRWYRDSTTLNRSYQTQQRPSHTNKHQNALTMEIWPPYM